jgi:hypothetical protein
MRNRFFAVLAVLAIVASACGGDSSSCGAIADDAIDLVQGLIDQVDDMSLEELSSLDTGFTADFETSIESLVAEAENSSCSDEEMEDLFRDKVDSLTAESDFGQLFIQQFTSDDLFSG